MKSWKRIWNSSQKGLAFALLLAASPGQADTGFTVCALSYCWGNQAPSAEPGNSYGDPGAKSLLGSSRWAYSNDAALNEAMYQARRYAQTKQLDQLILKYKVAAVTPASSDWQRQQYITAASAYSSKPEPTVIPRVQRPTPYPKSSIGKDSLDEILEPLWEQDRNHFRKPRELVAAVSKVQEKIASFRATQVDEFVASADYLEREMRRSFVDANGLIRDLPYAQTWVKTLTSDSGTEEGLRVRQGFNQLLVSQSTLNLVCQSGEGASSGSSCERIEGAIEALKFASVLADRLEARGRFEASRMVLDAIDESVSIISAFAEGLASGAISQITDLPQLILAMPELGEALVGIAPVIYRGLTDLPWAWEKIKTVAAAEYDKVLRASSDERAVIAGKICAEILGTIVVPGAGAKVAKIFAFEQAVGLGALSVAVGKVADGAVLAEKLLPDEAIALRAFAAAEPEVARAVALQVVDELPNGIALLRNAPESMPESARHALAEVLPRLSGGVWKDSGEINADLAIRYSSPPFAANSKILSRPSVEGEQFVRVIAEGKTKADGHWMMRKSDIEGLTPVEIQDRFALPFTPTHQVLVTLPKDVAILEGKVAMNYVGKGNGWQVYIDAKEVSRTWFSGANPL